MKERPIIFSAPMVRAILEGRKTQTRRIANGPDDWEILSYRGFGADVDNMHTVFVHSLIGSSEALLKCPYGVPGDRLWVRETFRVLQNQHGADIAVEYKSNQNCDYGKWKPSIFMPRWASRIMLEIKSVRVERLHEITEEDAISEGIERVGGEYSCSPWRNYLIGKPGEMAMHASAPSRSFQTLWDLINKDRAPWEFNPWVWVIEFERVK